MLITFYVLFLPAFHLQSQRRADAEMQRSLLEAELEQSQSEMDSLHRLETQTAVYQHDMRHHLNMRDGLPVSDRAGHGYGCRSIQAIAQRYGGLCVLSAQQGQFLLQIMLPALET